MQKRKLTINSFLDEKSKNLNASIGYAIRNHQKLHITAPVGTGKTTLAINIIEKYDPNYQILLLEPQISISTQIFNKLVAKNIFAFIYNSKTSKKLKQWEKDNSTTWPNTYISTIDGAWKLFENHGLDASKTIVILDESHSILQQARKDFDKSIRTIIESGCPLIGFSATESMWVLDKVLNFDRKIVITAKGIIKKTVIPFMVSSMYKTIAQVIKCNNLGKVIIFTENKNSQEIIKDAILVEEPNKEVVIWNSETRDNSEKVSWKNLMVKDELPQSTEVAIINSVVQSGININDNDIDLVMLVGNMDPLGFLQYLGRCRNYTGEFHFLHSNFGNSTVDWENIEETEKFLDVVEKQFQHYSQTDVSTFIRTDRSIRELYTKEDEEYRLNRCVAARRIFDQFRELHGTYLLYFLKKVAPDVDFKDYNSYTNIDVQNNSDKKAAYRANKKKKLPELVRKSAIYLVEMIPHLKPDWSHEKAFSLIDESCHIKNQAIQDGVLYVPNTRKRTLKNTITTSKQAGYPHLAKVLLAARIYRRNNKDKKRLNTIMELSMSMINKLLVAQEFFYYDFANNVMYKKALGEIENNVGDFNTKDDWIQLLQNELPGIAGAKSIASKLFDCCLFTESKKVTLSDGSRGMRQKLTKILTSWDEFLSAYDLDETL